MAERKSSQATMSSLPLRFTVRSVLLMLLAAAGLQAQQHTARRLGHPSTRFADPVQTVEDLRERLTCERLRSDVAIIVDLCEGWQGRIEDFRDAAATAPIASLQIPVGTRLPAMSTRRNGRPVLLRDVLWAGTEPIAAYEFFFHSQGRRYRCVTPRACCNFWVENLGPDLRTPVLALACAVPNEVPLARPLQVCLTLRNTGEVPAEQVTLALPIPAGATYAGPGAEANPAARRLVWRFPSLAAGASKEICADFTVPEPAVLTFAATATGASAQPVACHCTSRVLGIPAVLLEVIDLEDPIEVGQENTYEIRVLNQGSGPLTNLRLVCTLEDSQRFVAGTGATAVSAAGASVTSAPLATLAPKAEVRWQVVVEALAAGDVRFTTQLSADQCARPVGETEATQQY
jgi:hypothetical protein